MWFLSNVKQNAQTHHVEKISFHVTMYELNIGYFMWRTSKRVDERSKGKVAWGWDGYILRNRLRVPKGGPMMKLSPVNDLILNRF